MRVRAILLLLLLMVGAASAQDNVIPITSGDFSGEITNDSFSQRYSFEGVAGDVVTITMLADESALDPFLFLFDDTGQVLANGDDIDPTNRNAQIDYELPLSGTFIIEATRYQQELGTSTGNYTLSFRVNSATPPIDTSDPLSQPPQFGVEFRSLGIGQTIVDGNRLDNDTDRQYFAIGGRQGQLIRVVVRSLDTLETTVSLLNQQFTVISRVGLNSSNQTVIFAAIPQTGWYLVEVAQLVGGGDFTIRADLVSDTVLSQDSPIEAGFTAGRQEYQYIFNATINERVFINLTLLEGSEGVVPRLQVLDLQQNALSEAQSTGTQTRISLTAPRSGPYIIIVQNTAEAQVGDFRLQMRSIPADVSKLQSTEVTYNQSYTGTITQDEFIEYYRFTGKTGELVTIEMSSAAGYNQLDPYIILADGTLQELAFNDNIGASRAARIFQFALPRDDTYFILATRAGLERGDTTGNFDLNITVGQIVLEEGNLTATLSWEGDNDLNLFVNTPDGRTVSWANPSPDGTSGLLQIDSNTACETPSAQPVEHIVFDDSQALVTGDYTVWVWYQGVCSAPDAIPFSITITINDEVLLDIAADSPNPPILQPQQRFEASFRLTDTGNAVPLERGFINTPSEQQSASQGGDTLIIYGQERFGTITNTAYADFYHFNGTEGEIVRISAIAETGSTTPLDTVLVLRDNLDNNLEVADDISSRNYNSMIEYELPYTGRYIIGVTRYGVRDGTSTGDYRLTLERLE